MNTDVEHHETPPLPQEIPAVPARPLWTSLLVPPLVTVASGVMMSVMGRSYMDMLLTFMPTLNAMLIFGFSFVYFGAVSLRYRGTSLVFLVCCYVVGQIILCIALWVGSLLLAVARS